MSSHRRRVRAWVGRKGPSAAAGAQGTANCWMRAAPPPHASLRTQR